MRRVVVVGRITQLTPNGHHPYRHRYSNAAPRHRNGHNRVPMDQGSNPALVHGAVDENKTAPDSGHHTDFVSVECVTHIVPMADISALLGICDDKKTNSGISTAMVFSRLRVGTVRLEHLRTSAATNFSSDNSKPDVADGAFRATY